MKENWLGPSIRNETGSKDYQDLNDETKEFLSVISPYKEAHQLQDLLLNYFSREGEDVYKNTKGLTLFFYLDLLLSLEFCDFEVPQSTMIWKARFHMLHNQLLTSNSCFLQDKSIELYQKYLDWNEIEDKNIRAYLWIEYSNCLLTFYKYSKSEEALEKAREIIGIKLSLTGKLGKRTKYQSFEIPQLVLNIETESVDKFIYPEKSVVEEIIDNESLSSHENEEIDEFEESKLAHRDVKMDEDSILLEKVKLYY